MGEGTNLTEARMPPGAATVAESVPLHPMQRMAAAHLLESQRIMAPVTIFGEAEADGLVAFHQEIAERRADGPAVSVTHILLAILAATLSRHPRLNAMRLGHSLEVYADINIGLAMALADGNLIVPVIAGADRLSLGEIATAAADLRARAEAGKLALADVRGGTFTLTNAGMVPTVSWTTPIIPIGQAAILGIGNLRRAPVVRGDTVVVGSALPLSLTFDHTALNGYPASEFLADLAAGIADPRASGARLET